MNFRTLTEKAMHSSFYRWLLNMSMKYSIPYNIPHRLTIESISKIYIRTSLPLIYKNKNHLNGMHACALATIGEFTGGALLVSRLDPTKYRLILKELQMKYIYQAKSKVYAEYTISDSILQEDIIKPLQQQDAIEYTITIPVRDIDDKVICIATTIWQIKSWDKVKTKL